MKNNRLTGKKDPLKRTLPIVTVINDVGLQFGGLVLASLLWSILWLQLLKIYVMFSNNNISQSLLYLLKKTRLTLFETCFK